VPLSIQKAASQDTLQKLLDFEEKIRYPFVNYIYGEEGDI
jgi:hypothetical protein